MTAALDNGPAWQRARLRLHCHAGRHFDISGNEYVKQADGTFVAQKELAAYREDHSDDRHHPQSR
jgi:hypothetical protein